MTSNKDKTKGTWFKLRPVALAVSIAVGAMGGMSTVHAHTASVGDLAQLKAAIATANSDGLQDVITLTDNITFASAADTVAISVTDGQTLSIIGGGFTLSGNNLARVLDVSSSGVGSAVRISNLSIMNGFVTGAGGACGGGAFGGGGGAGGDSLGAGIRNAGTLTIIGSNVSSNKAAGGGGTGDEYYSFQAGGGGGGGGFGTTFGGIGGSCNGRYIQAGPSAGIGGRGAGRASPPSYFGGGGGSTVGGVGSNYSGTSNGGAGGTANNGFIAIGGGGGGASNDSYYGQVYPGGRGGHAAGGIYNTGTLTILNSTVTNNIGAGGGGAGHGGAGGSGVGGIWNAGGTLQLNAATNMTLATGNAAGAGEGGAGPLGPGPNGSGEAGAAAAQISTTNGGTTITDYADYDFDGLPDHIDTDDDNDGALDSGDAFPLDSSEWNDTDGDNLGDNSDPLVNDGDDLNFLDGTVFKDKSGSSVAFAGDFNHDGYGDYVIGTPGYDIPAVPPAKLVKDVGRAQVISGRNGVVLAEVIGTLSKDAMGFAVAGNGDMNHDGFDDVVVGAPLADDAANSLDNVGSVTVLYGPVGAGPQTVLGTVAKNGFGSAVALGDVNGDSHADILIGAPNADDLRDPAKKLVKAGSVTVIDGNTLVALPDVYYGSNAKAYAGTAVASGAFDAVAGDDIVIGAPKDDDKANKRTDAGSVTVYSIADATTPLLKQYGAVSRAYLGQSVAAGDVNGLPGDEVLAGAPGDDNGLLKDIGSVTILIAGAVPPVTRYGTAAKANFGNSVAVGDVNGDGYGDIIAGASKDDKPGTKITKDAGSVSVFSGNGYAQIGSTIYGDVSRDYSGSAVSAGDINGDGKADLIIGIPGFDGPATPTTKTIKDAGAVRIFNGAGL